MGWIPFRMGQAMTGEHAAALTAGLPLVYTAGLIWLRIAQLDRLATGVTRDHHQVGKHGLTADRAEADCGLVRLTTWNTTTPRPVIPCPRCRRPAWRLHAAGRAWTCWRCQPTGCERTEILLGDYACGLRIGLTGANMARRRGFLLQRMRTRHLLKGKTAKDLFLLAVAGPLLAPRPTWPRAGYKRGLGAYGPVFQRLAPHILPTAVDSLLHPDAYLIRFGGYYA